jgi:putative flippase GtrA
MSASSNFAYRVGAAARRPASWLQLLKFSVVGGSGYVINVAVFAVLASSLGIQHSLAAVGAFCVAVTNNFLWNRYWTFGPGEGRASFQAMRFLTVSVLSLLLNLAFLEAILVGTEVGEVTAQAIAVAAVMPFNFLGNKLWTFTD